MSPSEHPAPVIRREERLHVSTETIPQETVRIEKVIVTEQRTFTADVRREELRITRQPIAGHDPLPTAQRDQPTVPIVLILREEHLVITTVLVPVEKITVDVADVISEHHISESLRSEHIDIAD